MELATKLRIPNAVALIVDFGGGDIPKSMAGALVSTTPSCIAVGCRSDIDGETSFVLSDLELVNQSQQPVFSGVLETLSRRLTLRTVSGEIFLETPVPRFLTEINMWANDPVEPDQIIIGFK